MGTYAGYQGLNVPDLSAPFKEQMAGLMHQQALQKQQEFQMNMHNLKLKKAEMDKVDEGYYSAVAKISESGVTDYPSRTFQDIVFEGTDQGRTILNNAHKMYKSGQMTASQYKSFEANMLSSFSALKEYTTNAEEFAKAHLERMKNEESGYLEKERAEYNAKLSNLENKTASFDENGNMMWATLDSEGNVIEQQSLINLVSANNISNQFIDKVNLNARVKDIVGSNKGYTYVKGNKTITDPTAQEGYTGWLNGQVRTLTNGGDPQTVVSIMMDSTITSEIELPGGKKVLVEPGTFRTSDELKTKVEQEMKEISEDYELELDKESAQMLRNEITSMMIPITVEGGKDKYEISSKHIKLVEDRIKSDVKQALGYKETKKTTGGSGKMTQSQLISNKVRELSDKAWNEKSEEAFGNLDKNYVYIPSSDGSIRVYNAISSDGVKIKNPKVYKNLDPVTTAYGPEDLADYAESIATAQVRYEYGQPVPGASTNAGAGDDIFGEED